MSAPRTPGDEGGHVPPSGLPQTPAGFTGTRTTHDPEQGVTARLHYVNGEVVGIAITGPDGSTQHHEADEGAFRTVHAQTRFVWHAGDVKVEGGDRP